MEERGAGELRYKAFLSYSHRDAAAASRLHRRLETYRMPRRLVGSTGARGPVPERLWPIFRDRDELPAATDLSETVREALARSGSLIILCSPHAAASLWVAEEIETFRRLYPERPILAAIVEGDPPDCFPAALRAFGQDGTWHEPLATDLRPEGDGPHLGLLKLVAGITGVGLDALVQRDAQRKIRRVTAVTAGALAAMLLMAVLTFVAVNARSEAERQRAEAEGLIEFMLTDLREELTGVGRLEIMTDVNQRALAYYGAQAGQSELAALPDESLVRRARVLLALGEDNLGRGELNDALAMFLEAHRTTAEQLERAPDDPERIFAHSQSEFYVGRVAYERADFHGARRAWLRYKALIERLRAIDPRNVDWLKEAAFAEGSLCTARLEGFRDTNAALTSCVRALDLMIDAARLSGDLGDYRSHIANRLGYTGDALKAAGEFDEALRHQRLRFLYLERQLREDPANASLQVRQAWAQRAMAHLEARLGNRDRAIALISQAIQTVDSRVRQDPERVEWETELNEMRSERTGLVAG